MITFAGLTRDISDQEYLTPNNSTTTSGISNCESHFSLISHLNLVLEDESLALSRTRSAAFEVPDVGVLPLFSGVCVSVALNKLKQYY
jgi:hypothetical protein